MKHGKTARFPRIKLSRPKGVLGVLAVAGVAVAAIAGAGTGYALAYTGVPTAPPSSVFGCINFNGRTISDAYTVAGNFKGCNPKTQFPFTVSTIPGPGGTPPVTSVDGSVTVDDHGDSSNFGNWADDDLTVNMTLTNEGRVSVSHCSAESAPTQCYFYTATISRNGSFTTLDDFNSPANGTPVPLTTPLTGTVTGTATVEFYYSGTANPANLPTTALNEGGAVYSSPSGVAYTLAGFFPGADLSKPGTISLPLSDVTVTGYSWNYATNSLCNTWLDDSSNSDGTVAPYGTDITGANECSSTTS